MSEEGWRRFLSERERGQGLDDWVVVHGGATAFFATEGLLPAAALAHGIAEVAREASTQPLLSLIEHGLSVRLTRDVWHLDDEHIELARSISAVAAAHGAPADRAAVREVQVAVSARPAEIDLPFWRTVLGYVPCSDDNGVDELGLNSTVWMQELAPERPLRHAMHIDVSVARDRVDDLLQAAIAAGGRVVSDENAPEHWVLSDSAGNKVCLCAWPDGAQRAPGLQG